MRSTTGRAVVESSDISLSLKTTFQGGVGFCRPITGEILVDTQERLRDADARMPPLNAIEIGNPPYAKWRGKAGAVLLVWPCRLHRTG